MKSTWLSSGLFLTLTLADISTLSSYAAESKPGASNPEVKDGPNEGNRREGPNNKSAERSKERDDKNKSNKE